MTRRRHLIASAVIVGAVGVIAYAVVVATETRTPVVASGVVPSATLANGSHVPEQYVLARLIGSGSTSIAKLVGHRPAVLNFFASWCPQCAAELSSFATVSKADAGKVAFVGVDTGDNGNRSAARSLLKNAGDTYPVVVDDANYSVATAYGIARLPVTFFVGSDGTVRHEVLGRVSTSELRKFAAELLPSLGREQALEPGR